jgi:hypothetical protein
MHDVCKHNDRIWKTINLAATYSQMNNVLNDQMKNIRAYSCYTTGGSCFTYGPIRKLTEPSVESASCTTSLLVTAHVPEGLCSSMTMLSKSIPD